MLWQPPRASLWSAATSMLRRFSTQAEYTYDAGAHISMVSRYNCKKRGKKPQTTNAQSQQATIMRTLF